MVGQAGKWWGVAVVCLYAVGSLQAEVDGDGIIRHFVTTVPRRQCAWWDVCQGGGSLIR